MVDSVFDWNLAISRAGGNRDLAHELTGMLMETIRELKPQIKEALTQGHTQKASELTHKLHGGVAYTGAKNLQHAAREFEQLTRSGQLDEKAFKKLYEEMMLFEEFVLELNQD